MPQDPNAPWGWVPSEWMTPFGGQAAPVPPGLPPIEVSQVNDDVEAHGRPVFQRPPVPPEAPAPPADIGSNWDAVKQALTLDNARETAGVWGDYLAEPFGLDTAQRALSEKVSPPRTDAARIAQATGPIGTVGQIGKDVAPNAPQQPLVGRDFKFTPTELEQLQLLTPPPLEADAISGGMLPEQMPGNITDVDFSGLGKKAGELVGRAAGAVARGVDAGTMEADELGKFYAKNLSTEDQEGVREDIEGSRREFAAARLKEESTKALRAAEDNARIYQESLKAAQQRSAELDAEAQNLARKNPLDSITGSQKVFGVLASIVGGWAANKTGRNMGLEIVGQIADDAAQAHAQKLALNARQQGAVGDQVARSLEAYKAAEAVRLATYDGAIKQLETEVQNFDQRGTTAIRTMDNINALKAKRAELLAKAAEDERKRAEAAMKTALEIAKHQEDVRKNKANEKLEGWRIGETAKHNRAQEKNDAAQLDLEAKKLAAMGNKDAAAQLLERGIGGAPVLTTDENGNAKASYKLLSQADGTPFVAPTKEEAILFRKKKAAVDTISNLMAETIKLVQDNGWEPDFIQSPAWQKVKANWSTIMVKQKDFQDLGAITESDAKIINGLMGSKDPTGVRNTIPGMEKAFDNTVGQFNKDMRSIGYTGDDYAPSKTWLLGKPEETAADRAFKESEKRPSALDTATAYGKAETIPERAAVVDAAAQGMTPEQLKTIAELVATMNDTTKSQPERDAARARLNEGAAKGQTEQIRDAYTRALTGGLLESIPAGTD